MAKRMKYRSKLTKEQHEASSDEKVRGTLAHCAANIVMKMLYGARFVRMDLLHVIGFLARQFTRRTSTCDRRLYQLVC